MQGDFSPSTQMLKIRRLNERIKSIWRGEAILVKNLKKIFANERSTFPSIAYKYAILG